MNWHEHKYAATTVECAKHLSTYVKLCDGLVEASLAVRNFVGEELGKGGDKYSLIGKLYGLEDTNLGSLYRNNLCFIYNVLDGIITQIKAHAVVDINVPKKDGEP